jgi:carboxylesterase
MGGIPAMTLKRRLSEPFFFERGPTACLLLHGFAGSPAEIRPLGDYLAERGITVRAPLLPGHGTSPEDLGRTNWPQWVRAAEAELVKLRSTYGHMHLAGFSMGGLLTLFLAAHQPVASVTTLSCPFRLADWRQILVPLARISNPSIAAELESYDRFPMNAIDSLLHLGKRVRLDLARVEAPLLVLQGERDRWIAPESAEQILQGVSSSVTERVLLPNRNHLITLEQGREEVFALVHQWLLRNSLT